MKIRIGSNLNQVYSAQIRLIGKLTRTNRVPRVAALDTLARMRVRIFTKGLNSDNRLIGQYSRRIQPFWWFTPAGTPPLFRARLQKYAYKTKSGKIYYDVINHAQVREIVGRQSKFVDLEFSGQMRANLLPLPGLTFNSYAIGFTNPLMALRAEYNEKRYGMIFQTTRHERLSAEIAVSFEVSRIINQK